MSTPITADRLGMGHKGRRLSITTTSKVIEGWLLHWRCAGRHDPADVAGYAHLDLGNDIRETYALRRRTAVLVHFDDPQAALPLT